MDSLSYWIVFLTAALIINITPGPDLFLIISKTISQGRKTGFITSLGACSGAMVYVIATALGLSSILATSPLAFDLIKYAGAAYLVYLGLMAFKSKGMRININKRSHKKISNWKAFNQGVLVDLLNPKVAVFFMAFLPQFYRAELGHPSLQIFILGSIVVFVAMIVEFSVVLTASKTTSFFQSNPTFSMWMDRVLGSVLISLGIRLALFENINHE